MSQTYSNGNRNTQLSVVGERPDHDRDAEQSAPNHNELLDHLSGLLSELESMARSAHCETLAGLLRVASIEAGLRRNAR